MSRFLLNYEVLFLNKNAPWVIFIHGAGGSIRTWNKQTDSFRPFFNLLFFDLRDHGESKNIQPEYKRYSFELASKDLFNLMHHLNIDSAHFVVLSFGSVLIQHFCQRYPSKVHRVIVAGGLFGGNIFIRSFVHLARFFNLFLTYKTMYSLFSYLLMPRKRNQKARKVYQKYASNLSQSEYLKWVGLYDDFFQLLTHFKEQSLSHDMHIIMGSDDYVFLNAAKSFVERQSRSSITIIERSGHICNIESPQAFNRVALKFLLST